MTTRAQGTGLGLAIVKKIMEDHGALLQLDDRAGGGAIVRVIIPALARGRRRPERTRERRHWRGRMALTSSSSTTKPTSAC